jgi:RHS repeat-associated protein
MLKQISHSRPSEILSSFDYITNEIGNIISITTKKGVHRLTYDNNNQLISASHPEIIMNEVYTYDSLGNRVADQTGNYIYNDSRQKMTEDPSHTFVYDLRGNIVQKTEKLTGRIHKYTYNSEDKLIKFELYDNGNNLIKDASYTFDVLGRRIEKVVRDYSNNKNTTRRFVYDGQEVLLALNENNDVLAKFTHSTLKTDDVLAIDVTPTGEQKGYATTGSYQYLKDHLGSVVDISDNSGNIVQHFVYSSFGEIEKITNKTGAALGMPALEHHFAYTGREYDEESNLYYYRARHLDSKTGRFIQRDPIEGDLSQPLTKVNKHIYVLNNPFRFIDPSGKANETGPWDVSDYCGPGAVGDDGNGGYKPTTNGMDQACKRHDNAYADWSKATNLNWEDSWGRFETNLGLSREGLLRMRSQPLKGYAVFVTGMVFQIEAISLLGLSAIYTVGESLIKAIF